ncbi:MAG: hypothetical protein ACK5HT_20345 [Draconibacterium sp.]
MLVLPVYLWVVHNAILTQHTHFYANGTVITHYHPLYGFKGDQPINKHHHSEKELRVIASLNSHFYEMEDWFSFDFEPDQLYFGTCVFADTSIFPQTGYSKLVPRGPPASAFHISQC